MTIRYVNRKTTRLYTGAAGRARTMILIFGDEVDITGEPEPVGQPTGRQRTPVTFRGKTGFINTAHLADEPALEMYFIDVGQGDSTFIVTPGRKKILIDGGANNRAFGFLAWKYRLDHPASEPLTIDLLVVSHADGDHLQGLIPVVNHPKIRIGQIVHNGIALYKSGRFAEKCGDLSPDKHWLTTTHDDVGELSRDDLRADFLPWIDAITAHHIACRRISTSDVALDIGDPAIAIDVLGPRYGEFNHRPALVWFGDHAHTINGHSVVLRLRCGEVALCLAGDLNIEGAKNLMLEDDTGARFDAHVLKAPHHGSHEFHWPFLAAVNPQISVVSSGDDPDHGHPRAIFLGAIGAASRSGTPLLFSTEIAATFVEAGATALAPDTATLANLDTRAPNADGRARRLFKRRLNGMINVRTDGKAMHAARRVAAGYWWESYGPLAPAARSR